jgi:hypothetical protein
LGLFRAGAPLNQGIPITVSLRNPKGAWKGVDLVPRDFLSQGLNSGIHPGPWKTKTAKLLKNRHLNPSSNAGLESLKSQFEILAVICDP